MVTNSLLGREIRLYQLSPIRRSHRFFYLLLGLMGVLLPLILAVWQFQSMTEPYGYYAALQRSQCWIFLSIFAYLSFLLLAFIQSWHSQLFVAMHQNGIRFRLKFNKVNWLLYQNIKGLQEELIQEDFLFIPIQKKYRVNVLPKNGNTIRVPSSIYNLPELYTNLGKIVNPALKQMALDELNSGEWVDFGEIKVSQNHIWYRKQIMAQKELKEISICTGNIKITRKIQPSASNHKHLLSREFPFHQDKIPLSEVFNLDIFLELIETRIQP
jgi:hypothetical protein